MKLIPEKTQEGTKYIAQCTFEEKDIAKAARFRWDPTKRRWWTDDVEKAAKLARHAEGELKTQLEAISAEHDKAREASRALDADVDLPVPDGLEYLPFQKAGIAYSLKQFGLDLPST